MSDVVLLSAEETLVAFVKFSCSSPSLLALLVGGLFRVVVVGAVDDAADDVEAFLWKELVDVSGCLAITPSQWEKTEQKRKKKHVARELNIRIDHNKQ